MTSPVPAQMLAKERSLHLTLADEGATDALARRLAAALGPGDSVLLSGAVGAGKSALARGIIRARLGDPGAEVPSPTFTLVQTYDDGICEIWHADLYRLGAPEELIELGLDEAWATAICLIEWPDRLGEMRPDRALTIEMAALPHGPHEARISGRAELLDHLDPPLPGPVAAFLSGTPWAEWQREAISGDASSRRYWRLHGPGGETAILMDGAGDARAFAQFCALARHLRGAGLAAPRLLHLRPEDQLLILEDLGETDFAGHLRQHPQDGPALTRAAMEVLAAIAPLAPPPGLTRMTPEVGANMLEPLFTHYAPEAPRAALEAAVAGALSRLDPPQTLSLRDFHAENLIWRPERGGLDRVGLLDFQDAFLAPRDYDLASYTRDARRDVSRAEQALAEASFAELTGRKVGDVALSTATLAIQRNLRILGIFARLARQDGKHRYLDMMPRLWGYITADLAQPALAELREAVLAAVPPPDAALIAGLRP